MQQSKILEADVAKYDPPSPMISNKNKQRSSSSLHSRAPSSKSLGSALDHNSTALSHNDSFDEEEKRLASENAAANAAASAAEAEAAAAQKRITLATAAASTLSGVIFSKTIQVKENAALVNAKGEEVCSPHTYKFMKRVLSLTGYGKTDASGSSDTFSTMRTSSAGAGARVGAGSADDNGASVSHSNSSGAGSGRRRRGQAQDTTTELMEPPNSIEVKKRTDFVVGVLLKLQEEEERLIKNEKAKSAAEAHRLAISALEEEMLFQRGRARGYDSRSLRAGLKRQDYCETLANSVVVKTPWHLNHSLPSGSLPLRDGSVLGVDIGVGATGSMDSLMTTGGVSVAAKARGGVTSGQQIPAPIPYYIPASEQDERRSGSRHGSPKAQTRSLARKAAAEEHKSEYVGARIEVSLSKEANEVGGMLALGAIVNDNGVRDDSGSFMVGLIKQREDDTPLPVPAEATEATETAVQTVNDAGDTVKEAESETVAAESTKGRQSEVVLPFEGGTSVSTGIHGLETSADACPEPSFEQMQIQRRASSGLAVSRAAKLRAQIGQAFARINIDQAGDIDAGEFLRAIASLGVQITRADVDALFARFDVDGSGTMNLDEFFNMLDFSGQTSSAARSAANQLMEDLRSRLLDQYGTPEQCRVKVKQIFEEADREKSGTLKRREFAVACKRLGLDLSSREVDIVFKRFDLRRSNSISFEEVVNSLDLRQVEVSPELRLQTDLILQGLGASLVQTFGSSDSRDAADAAADVGVVATTDRSAREACGSERSEGGEDNEGNVSEAEAVELKVTAEEPERNALEITVPPTPASSVKVNNGAAVGVCVGVGVKETSTGFRAVVQLKALAPSISTEYDRDIDAFVSGSSGHSGSGSASGSASGSGSVSTSSPKNTVHDSLSMLDLNDLQSEDLIEGRYVWAQSKQKEDTLVEQVSGSLKKLQAKMEREANIAPVSALTTVTHFAEQIKRRKETPKDGVVGRWQRSSDLNIFKISDHRGAPPAIEASSLTSLSPPAAQHRHLPHLKKDGASSADRSHRCNRDRSHHSHHHSHHHSEHSSDSHSHHHHHSHQHSHHRSHRTASASHAAENHPSAVPSPIRGIGIGFSLGHEHHYMDGTHQQSGHNLLLHSQSSNGKHGSRSHTPRSHARDTQRPHSTSSVRHAEAEHASTPNAPVMLPVPMHSLSASSSENLAPLSLSAAVVKHRLSGSNIPGASMGKNMNLYRPWSAPRPAAQARGANFPILMGNTAASGLPVGSLFSRPNAGAGAGSCAGRDNSGHRYSHGHGHGGHRMSGKKRRGSRERRGSFGSSNLPGAVGATGIGGSAVEELAAAFASPSTRTARQSSVRRGRSSPGTAGAMAGTSLSPCAVGVFSSPAAGRKRPTSAHPMARTAHTSLFSPQSTRSEQRAFSPGAGKGSAESNRERRTVGARNRPQSSPAYHIAQSLRVSKAHARAGDMEPQTDCDEPAETWTLAAAGVGDASGARRRAVGFGEDVLAGRDRNHDEGAREGVGEDGDTISHDPSLLRARSTRSIATRSTYTAYSKRPPLLINVVRKPPMIHRARYGQQSQVSNSPTQPGSPAAAERATPSPGGGFACNDKTCSRTELDIAEPAPSGPVATVEKAEILSTSNQLQSIENKEC